MAVDVGTYNEQEQQFVKKPIKASNIQASNGKTAEDHILDESIHLDEEQAQKIDDAIPQSEKGKPDGVAPLDGEGKISEEYLPGMAEGGDGKLDCAYCTSEADMKQKNLRDGAIVFLEATD